MTNTNHNNIEDIYELTPLQQGMLFHTLYAPESGMYVEQVACKLLGKLSISALQKAWRRVIRENPVLRSSFYWEEVDKPLQIVHRRIELPWEQHNWSHESPATQQKLLEALLQRDQREGFELTEAPLMRLTLITLGSEHYQFVWTSHHILMDGWSSALLFKEVFTLYEGFQRGYEHSLSTRRPYRDYILWLQQQDQDKAERFWREKLRGFTAPTALGEAQSFQHTANEEQHAVRERRLSPAKTEALQQFARQQRLTLNTLMQGAWALLLSRYSGERDVVFGATMSGRPATLEQVENMIGLFINTLPVRVQLPEHMELQRWLQQLQAEQVELMQYEYSALLQVQEWSEVPAGTSLFGSLVIFENYPIYAPEQETEQSLELADVKVFEKTNYPLNFLIGPGQELLLKLIYSSWYFDDISSERILGHLESILDAMLANPAQPLWQISPLTQEERVQLLVTWNATSNPYPEQTIQQLVEAQVARTPEARAVTSGQETLSYAELNRRANQVAHLLRALGVGPETLVGLCVERSLEMVVGLLGILKAGGAYVPLDPTFPAERVAYMLEDAQVTILLTQKQLQASLLAGQAHVISLDENEILALADEDNPVEISDLEHLAYVIYTSGSTGRPKGVQITQRAAVNLLTSMQHKPGLTAHDQLLAVTTLSFDIATLEMLLPLITGAHLIIAPHEITVDGPALAKLLESTRATVMQATPITWRMLNATGWRPPARLKILCGGEALPSDLGQQLASTAKALYNVYGPTETTIWSTVEYISPNTTLMSIGRPIANTTIYLLDAQLQPVPTGVVGELYIGGDGLSRGYLHRPDLSAERFLPDPFSNRPGARIYHTGDLACYLEDGRLLCLGRADFQVKLHGFRIELGEIESVLRQHAGVHEGVVVLREDRPGDQRLVAYLVPEGTDKVNEMGLIQAVRANMREQLPDYMIPADIMLLESLPRTPNNKIDRKALPLPERRGTELSTEALRTPVEQELALLWEELLGAQHVGRSDHFFALGGHSLLLTQLASRIQTAFHLEMPLRTLFEAATLEKMAASITSALQRRHHLIPSEPIRAVSRERALPLSFAQQRLWFLQQLDLQNTAYNMPTAIRLRGQLAIPLLEQALREIIQRHESLRTRFTLVNGEPGQVITEEPKFLLSTQDLSELTRGRREEELQRIASQEAQRPFRLSEDLPIRAHLLQMETTEYVLLLTLHHIVSDGWSMGVLVQEVVTLYTAFAQGKRSPLLPLPIQYADFAIWQRQRLQGTTLETLLDYWQRQLAEAPPLLDLPIDHPRPVQQSFQGKSEHFQLSQELSQALGELAREEQVTLFMLLFAAFALLLSVYSRQNDILIGTPIANRTKQELEDLIGVFINTLVLRARLNPEETFRELLASVRDTTLEAYTHQDLPFESLVEILAPERDLSHHPLFQVMFVLQNAPMPPVELPELQLQPVEISNGSARFDLTLALEEGPEGLQGTIEYNMALFELSTITHIQKHFITLLASVVKDPEQKLWQISLIDAVEKDLLLRISNQTQ
ncbi:MAG TPA: amino acid adenylation domain-containing protein [Ktedonobacteraceae bacterium]